MATINFLILNGKTLNTSIYVRYSNGRGVDFKTVSGITINRNHWDPERQCLRNLNEIENRFEINSKLAKLKIFILDQSNIDYVNGSFIDTDWLKSTIKKFFNRPKHEINLRNEKHSVYISDFANWWIENHAKRWKVKSGKYLSEKSIAQYSIVADVFKKFEGSEKVFMRNITGDILDDFANYLNNENYAPITAKRMIGRFKFFCSRADAMNFEINRGYMERVFVAEEEQDYTHPYLNESEIELIFKFDFSHDEELDNIRDLFVTSLLSGLRISDFMHNLSEENIQDGYIELKTFKTKHPVSIPIHSYIKSILKKRHGMLPYKVEDKVYNKKIKLICQLAGIDEVIAGAIMKIDKETGRKRKVFGYYPKYMLIASHSARRSMTTNLYGKIPNSDLTAILGWKNESQMLHYIKKTKRESANVLKKLWEK